MVTGKLDEQRAILDETAVEKLESAITGILRDLGHDPATEYVRQVVARRLRVVATSTAPRRQYQSPPG